jgi:hypothetical protein
MEMLLWQVRSVSVVRVVKRVAREMVVENKALFVFNGGIFLA